MAKFSIDGDAVAISQGRGRGKVSVKVSFAELEKWARKMKLDTPKLMEKSFANACAGLKKKFASVMKNGGGVCGVPKFRDFETFTKQLREVQGIQGRPMGGVLAESGSIGAWKRNGWQYIGWKDYLAETARKFQEGLPGTAEQHLLDNANYRHYLHRRGIKDIPRTYTRNPRQVLPEPFGSYVQEHLKEWAQGSYYKQLAKLMAKATATPGT